MNYERSTSPYWPAMAIALAVAGALALPVRGANYLVDPNYTGTDGAAANGYTGEYKTVNAALSASGVPSGASPTNPNRIYLAPGTYNTANVTGVSLINGDSNIALIGLSGNPDDVVITSTLDANYNPGTGAIGTTASSSLQLTGNGISASGITFANSTDTPYIVNTAHVSVTPQGTYTGNPQTASFQDVALHVTGDELAFSQCKFLGYQDTLFLAGGRAYFTNCTINGNDDFIFGNSTAVFSNSIINVDGNHSGGAITAASTDKRTSNGLVFLNSTITENSVHGNPVIDAQNAATLTPSGIQYLGRPWGWQQPGGDASVVLISTKMASVVPSVGWLAWNSNETNAANGKNGGNPLEDTRYAEFNSTDLSGNPLNTASRISWSHQLTAAEAAAYTVTNIFSPESNYAWYGTGYTAADLSHPGTGSADPTNPNFSWPAYWGDRNSNNDTSNENVSGIFPTPGNPAAYSDPSWVLAGAWNPDAQLAAAVPEPATLALGTTGVLTLFLRRRPHARSI